MLKYLITSLLLLCLSSGAFSQIQLNLLDGRQIKLESYVFHSDQGYMDYSYMNKKDKVKNTYAELDDVYSININGKDSVIYKQMFEEEYALDEMNRIVLARQYAHQEYNPWWAYATGMIVGCGSMFLPMNGMTKLVFPLVYTAGIAFASPTNSFIRKRHEIEVNDEMFVYGYKSTGRKKIFKNSTLGVLGGIFASGIIWTTLYFSTAE